MSALAGILANSTSRFGDRPFLVFPHGDTLVQLTFRDVQRQVEQWAGYLARLGLGPGNRVAVISPKAPAQIRAFYACWWVGCIAVPICENLGDVETAFIIRDSEPDVILAGATVEERIREIAGDVPVVDFAQVSSQCESLPAPDVARIDDHAVAALIYTSGSTGRPKGVALTHRNFTVNARSALDAIQIQCSDRVVSLLPYWHSFALVVEVIIAAMAGASVAIPRDKRDFQRNIARYQPTIVLLVPRIAEALRRGILKRVDSATPRLRQLFGRAIRNASRVVADVSGQQGTRLQRLAHRAFYNPLVFRQLRRSFGGRLRFFVSGGAPLDYAHQRFFKCLGVPIYQGYGLTEATPVISVNVPDSHKLGSSGQLLWWLTPEHGGDYVFRDAEGVEGKHVRGELLVKGDCVMTGYWRHTDASAKTLQDGWLHTGDIGYVDLDGFLFLEGRRGNMIVLMGGENVHPEPIENAVRNSAWVTEAMVIGDRCKNVYACVNVESEVSSSRPDLDMLAELKRQIAEQTADLAAHQRPKDILVLPEFRVDDGTLTPTMKIRRHRVWDQHGVRIREFLAACGENPHGVGTEGASPEMPVN